MPIKSLSSSSLLDFQKYSSVLAGNDPFILFTSPYELLETQVLTTNETSITFSSLGTYAADYKHLQIRMSARGSTTANLVTVINADTAANYSWHIIEANGSTVSGAGLGSRTYMFNAVTTAQTDGFNAGVVDLLDAYNTNKYLTIRTLSGVTGSSNYVHFASGSWRNTASLTSIELKRVSGLHTIGSRFSLYGLKG